MFKGEKQPNQTFEKNYVAHLGEFNSIKVFNLCVAIQAKYSHRLTQNSKSWLIKHNQQA